MLSLSGIGVLVGGASVKVVQAEGIPGEVGGHPVHDDSDAPLVQLVDEVLQVIGDAEAAGGGIIAGYLVAPGGIQGMLGQGEQLHMSKAHLLQIRDQVAGDIPVGEEFSLAGAPPGAQVALINIHGVGIGTVLGPPGHPVPVAPLIARVQVVDLGGDVGPCLGVEGIGISLPDVGSLPGVDSVLVGIIALDAGDKDLPDAPFCFFHGGGIQIPAVEIPDQRDPGGVGGPDPEQIALRSVLRPGGVGAKAAPGVGGAPFGEGFQLQKQVVGGKCLMVIGQNDHLSRKDKLHYGEKSTREQGGSLE